jgi:hypothetical protein
MLSAYCGDNLKRKSFLLVAAKDPLWWKFSIVSTRQLGVLYRGSVNTSATRQGLFHSTENLFCCQAGSYFYLLNDRVIDSRR